MKDTYRGETNGKRLARYLLWLHCSSRLHAEFKAKKKVCLAGRTLGDLSTLEGLGVSTRKVVLAERCDAAFRIASTLRPDANIHNGDVLSLIDQCTDAVFLDFCSYLNEQTVTYFRSAFEKLQMGSVLAVAFMRGRERGDTFKLKPIRERSVVKEPVFDRNSEFNLRKGKPALPFINGKTAVMTRGEFNFKEDRGKVAAARTLRTNDERLLDRERLAGDAAGVVHDILLRDNLDGEVFPLPFFRCAYRSGVPMIVVAYHKVPLASLENGGLSGFRPAHYSFLRSSGNDSDDLVRKFAIRHPNGPKVFNLSPGTVAAWRAHETRRQRANTEKP